MRIFSEIDTIRFVKSQSVAMNFKLFSPPPHELVLTSGGYFQGNADLCLYNRGSLVEFPVPFINGNEIIMIRYHLS